MSVHDRCILLLTAILTAASAFGDALPSEPAEGGVLLLPGRLPFGATALPDGSLLAPCEDQTLTVLDQTANPLARWSATGRFSAPVTVAPRSSYQLLAAPQTNGRVDVLVWDSRTRVLATDFAATRPSEALATAWGQDGTLVAGWRDGSLEAWSSQGNRLWSATAGTEVRFVLYDETLGVYTVGPGKVVLFNHRGQESQSWAIEGEPRGLLQTLAGDLYVWTSVGLWKKAVEATAFVLFAPSPELLGVAVDRQNHLLLTETSHLRRLSPEGTVQRVIPLASPALTASAIDDRGRIVVGTASGQQMWTYDGRLLARLDTEPSASALQFGDRGNGAWSSTDWRVHVWTGFRWPTYGWPQEGGSPGRSYSARRPASVAVRSLNWANDPDFGYLYELAASGEESKQREVLDRIATKAASGDLLQSLPFANLLLLKVARSGLTDLILRDRNTVANNWPQLRLRAYALLANTAAPEDREELIGLLQREFDPTVAAQGTAALAQSGWDGDGRLMRLLADLQTRMSSQPIVADAVIDAARTLWLANGQSADPALIPLVRAVYQGPYARSIKLKAQKFFQDLIEAP